MTALLHLRYVYKKAKLIPGKAQSALQFVDEYEKLKENKGHVSFFMDATHPLHNPVVSNFKRGAPEQHGAAASQYQWRYRYRALACDDSL
jgi:hypothetical protein